MGIFHTALQIMVLLTNRTMAITINKKADRWYVRFSTEVNVIINPA